MFGRLLVISGVAVLGILAFSAGCGGTSKRQLQNRYAQRRSAPDNDDPPQAETKANSDLQAKAPAAQSAPTPGKAIAPANPTPPPRPPAITPPATSANPKQVLSP